MPEGANKRGADRLPSGLSCRLAVSADARSASLGDIENITMDGVFVATTRRLPLGTVVPLAFGLGDGGDELRPTAEVVHHDARGMGLKFTAMGPREARRLRRYVADLQVLVVHRQSMARLRDAATRRTEVVTERGKLRHIIEHGGHVAPFIVIPEGRGGQVSGRLQRIAADGMHLACEAAPELAAGAAVLVLQTQERMSFSLQTRVVACAGLALHLALPERIEVSERRRGSRGGGASAGMVVLSLPWRPGEVVRWPLCDVGPGGLSFRADPQEVYFWPGTELPGAVLEQDGHAEPLAHASVRHLTAMRDDDGHSWLRVGIAFGSAAAAAAAQDTAVVPRAAAHPPLPGGVRGHVQAAGRAVAAAWARGARFYHRHFGPADLLSRQAAFAPVYFPGLGEQVRVAALLNTTQPDATPLRGPLVIVMPGFAGRKEASAALALVLVQTFAREGRELAVLRLDGTNNLGESTRDPGCADEGRHTAHFTVSGEADDLLAALAWALESRSVVPTEIVVVSHGMAAIAARHALTTPAAAPVGAWIALGGPASADAALQRASGGVDVYAQHLAGQRLGETMVLGCLLDLDRHCADLAHHRLATFADARREMAQVRAACTWIVRRDDDAAAPSQVAELMAVEAAGPRTVLDSAHDPLAAADARDAAAGALVTKSLWRHLFGRDIAPEVPSRAYVSAVVQREWQRVRPAQGAYSREDWRAYITGDGGGMDVCLLMPEYRQLVADQVRLAMPQGRRFLELGAGTGNVAQAAALLAPTSMTALDWVPEALAALRGKLDAAQPIALVAASLHGSPRIAMRRFLGGELGGLAELAARMPGRHADALTTTLRACTPDLYAVLRGATMDIGALLREADLPVSLEPALRDIQTLARLVRGRVAVDDAAAAVSPSFVNAVRSSAGLPFADASFDSIVCSLTLPYLHAPADAMAEMARVLAPGGTLVVSCMLPGATASAAHLALVRHVEALPEVSLPAGTTRAAVLAAAQRHIDQAGVLARMQRDGLFASFNGEALARLARHAGLEATEVVPTYGVPPEAVILSCRRAED